MRFTIRDMLLITALVAVSLGWWIDHRLASSRYAENEAKWRALFDDAMVNLSVRSPKAHDFETPDGPVTVNRKADPESEK